MFTIKPRTRIRERISWEEGGCYETGYEICYSNGEIIYDFADEDIKNFYEELNRKEEENTMNLDEKLINTASDIIDIFEELLDKLDITLPDKWRDGEEDEARIFGDTYYELENKIVERLRKEENTVNIDMAERVRETCEENIDLWLEESGKTISPELKKQMIDYLADEFDENMTAEDIEIAMNDCIENNKNR